MKVVISDFSRVLLFDKDPSFQGSLNEKHRQLSQDPRYNLLDHFRLNEELLAFFEGLKGKYRLYIFTTETIQEAPEIAPRITEVFDGVFSGIKLGLSKKDPSSYRMLSEKLGVPADEIVFIDDLKSNTDAARKAGLQTIEYVSNEQVMGILGEPQLPPQAKK